MFDLLNLVYLAGLLLSSITLYPKASRRSFCTPEAIFRAGEACARKRLFGGTFHPMDAPMHSASL